jgi:hypothetical protein
MITASHNLKTLSSGFFFIPWALGKAAQGTHFNQQPFKIKTNKNKYL